MTKAEIIKKYGADTYQKYLDHQKQFRAEHKNNPEYIKKRREIRERYEKNNADKISERRNKPEYREKAKERARRWYEEHKDYAIERNRVYHEENPDIKKKSQSNYRKNHQDRIKAYNISKSGRATKQACSYRRADKRLNRGESTITTQWILDNIYTKPCFYCGESDWTKLGCDRIDNSKPHTPDNCVCCCYKCNTKRGKLDFKTFCEKMGLNGNKQS